MTQTPTLTGQDIGQAHYATRAVLERVLADLGLGFHQSVALNQLAGNGSRMSENDLVARLVHGLKIAEPVARDGLTAAIDQGLIARTPEAGAEPELVMTAAGKELHRRVNAAITQITQRLYGGLPAEDLAVAHRLLVTVTERANAELAG
jgi:hypothetical protein